MSLAKQARVEEKKIQSVLKDSNGKSITSHSKTRSPEIKSNSSKKGKISCVSLKRKKIKGSKTI